MTMEEMFNKLKEEQNKTKHAHHVTTNQIYAATKISLVIAVLTAVLAMAIAYSLWEDEDAVRLNRAIGKGLLGLHSEQEMLRRIEMIVRHPVFSWDNTFQAHGIKCQTIGELADSGTNRFTELLKERRDGPLALTLNK